MKKQSYSETVPARIVTPISLTTMVQAAMVAAIYVVLTFIANALGLANYAVQVRFSEALTILPYFTPAADRMCVARYYFRQSGNIDWRPGNLWAAQVEMVCPYLSNYRKYTYRPPHINLRIWVDD